jgi:hypothetical protein
MFKKVSYWTILSQLNPTQMTVSVDTLHLFPIDQSINVKDAALLHQGQIMSVTNLIFSIFFEPHFICYIHAFAVNQVILV